MNERMKEKIIIIGILIVLVSIYLLQEWIISQSVTLIIKPIPKGFFQFDISQIPKNAIIKEAVLEFTLKKVLNNE